ncbi:MAG: hypothetical protein OXB95_02355 [Rhodobacteraceae bacterium]|nr:hypothetical protein [Paracoccaceae bacterium]
MKSLPGRIDPELAAQLIFLDCQSGVAGNNPLSMVVNPKEGAGILTAVTKEGFAGGQGGFQRITKPMVNALNGTAARLARKVSFGGNCVQDNHSPDVRAQPSPFKTHAKLYRSGPRHSLQLNQIKKLRRVARVS